MVAWKSLALLALISPFLTELMSGNTTISSWFQPVVILFLFLGYSLPVIVIRELVLRWKLGLFGTLLIGLAYGIYNEGLLAKTLLREVNVPIPAYDHYGYFFGLNVPWSFTIVPWHALFAVLFPILITHFLVPKQSNIQWLGKKFTNILGIVLLLFGSLVFFGKNGDGPGSLTQFIVLIVIMAICIIIAKTVYSNEKGFAKTKFRLSPLFAGMSLQLFYVLLFILAENKINLLIFFSIVLGGYSLYLFWLKKKSWISQPSLLLFGIGAYIVYAVPIFGFFARNALELIIGSVLVEVFVLWLFFRVKKQTSSLARS